MKGRAAMTDSLAAQKDGKVSSSDGLQGEETDGQIQARALKQVMMRMGGKDDEGPPLTTRAVKELERAQKAVVHCHTLIKISLPGPDQVCLQAYFHPRDTVEDIAQWLRSECFSPAGGDGEGEGEGGGAQHDFDLYTTPPRRSLFAPKEREQEVENTLQDLSLVPAAVIYLAWQGQGKVGGSSHSYLSPTLQAKLQENSEDLSFQSFPSGQRLVPSDVKRANDEAAAGGKSGSSRDKVASSGSGSGSSDSSGGKKSTKPKWFKL